MRIIKLTLAYDGTEYAGWQFQAGERSVQEVLETAIEEVTGEKLRVIGSGRTDAGVHAIGQVAAFRTESRLSAEVFQRALNAHLPADIAVLEAVEADEGFHPIRDATRKRYRYTICDGPVRDVFRRTTAWYCRFDLDAEAMHRAGQAIVGTHDFQSFQTQGSSRRSTVRTVFDLVVRRGAVPGTGEEGDSPHLPERPATNLRLVPGFAQMGTVPFFPGPDQRVIAIEIEADGFLYNMVRCIVGTMVQVGRGNRAESWPAEVLVARDRRAAGPTAPARGLCLLWVMHGEGTRGGG